MQRLWRCGRGWMLMVVWLLPLLGRRTGEVQGSDPPLGGRIKQAV